MTMNSDTLSGVWPAALERSNPACRLRQYITWGFAFSLACSFGCAIYIAYQLFSRPWDDGPNTLRPSTAVMFFLGGPVGVAAAGVAGWGLFYLTFRSHIRRERRRLHELVLATSSRAGKPIRHHWGAPNKATTAVARARRTAAAIDGGTAIAVLTHRERQYPYAPEALAASAGTATHVLL